VLDPEGGSCVNTVLIQDAKTECCSSNFVEPYLWITTPTLEVKKHISFDYASALGTPPTRQHERLILKHKKHFDGVPWHLSRYEFDLQGTNPWAWSVMETWTTANCERVDVGFLS
jgi:hypothetical protein